MSEIIKIQRAKKIFLLFIWLLSCFLFGCTRDLQLLFTPDPQKEMIYQYSFHEKGLHYATNVVACNGFISEHQGLQLLPASSGDITFEFNKGPQQGCLLRVWFYGDEGKQHPNAIKVSVDQGTTFQKVSDSGNYVGAVFELSHYLKERTHFQLLFEATNHAPYTSVIFDKIEIILTENDLAQPQLPNFTKIAAVLLILLMLVYFLVNKKCTGRERLAIIVLVIIILVATYLRWNEVVRIAGTLLDADARGYYQYAQQMNLFSDKGFFSAQFGEREPLYIFVVKLFMLFFGDSETHLRFVSFAFSIVTIFLTYRIGKEWFNGIVGLTAAFILAVHPYLITLSARGLRAEWFTSLILLFVYYGYVKESIAPRWRALITGLLVGALLLTRSESLLMIIILMSIYLLAVRSKWNFKRAAIALLLGSMLYIPHLYSIYENQGDPFYTMNKYARFYTNREFMGNPGFPTKEEIIEKGMYTGPTVTPVDYYLKLHTPWQLIKYSMVGFTKINLTMPLCFAMGKGNLRTVTASIKSLRENYGRDQLLETGKLFISIVQKDWLDYALAVLVLASFLLGVVLIAFSPYWMLLLYIILFQIQTSFLAYLGIDTRLTVQSYPLIALCCGYCIWRVSNGLRRRCGRPVVSTAVSATD